MKLKYLLLMGAVYMGSSLQAQQKITEETSFSMPSIAGQALSLNGEKLAYVQAKTNLEANKVQSELIILDIKSGKKETVATQVSDPQWSPDGTKLAFRGNINGQSGIFYITTGDNTPKFVAPVYSSNHFLGHSAKKNYAWSPDGKYIAYVGADAEKAQVKIDPAAPKVIERILYKSRTSFSDNVLTKIHLVEVASGNVKVLTDDKFDSHSLTWAPDSKRIAYVSNHTSDPDNNYNNDLFIVDISNSNVKQITNTIGTEHNPNWSPDGKYILYPATIRPLNTKDSSPEDLKLYLYQVANGEVTCLTTDLDERLSGGEWMDDSKHFYFGFPRHGKRVLYKGSIDGKTFTPVIDKEASVGAVNVSNKRISFTMSDFNSANEVYISDNEGKTVTQLTNESSNWLKDKDLSKKESFWFKSHDGVDVQGFIAYPANVPAGTKIPVIQRIHGGPHGAFGYSYTDIVEVLTGKGYAVVFINPRGSTGYGQKFSDGTYQAWGGGDYLDLMKGLDYALEKYPFLDKNRMGVTGGSYGGFMTNWVVTQTDRFKAAVTSASVSNLISFYGTSIYPDLIETEFNGMPWDNYSLLWHFSPMAHINKVKTPTLIVHGENDMDVPITQAEEFFIGLKKVGIPTRFVRYPNEGHGMAQPKNRLHNNKELLAWFDKYLK